MNNVKITGLATVHGHAPVSTSPVARKVLAAIRTSAYARTNIPFGRGSKQRWCENVDTYFRVTGFAYNIISRLPAGYYTDANCYGGEGTVHSIVVQLPTRRGKERYYAGYKDPYNKDAAVIDLGSVCDTKEEAARDADYMAQAYAEECREHDAQFMAEQDIESARGEIAEARKAHSALCNEIRAVSRMQFSLLDGSTPPARLSGHPSAICQALRASLRQLRKQAAQAIKVIKARRDDPWSAVSDY